MSESEYETESDDEAYLFYNETHKLNYFNNCDKCIPVKNRQKVLLGKCDVLDICKDQIVDYYGCDKCCKLRNLFDDYICPFIKLCTYPEYEEVHKIMRDDVQKKGYTLELHSEMKTIYENLDTFDFKKWHHEKMNCFKTSFIRFLYLLSKSISYFY